MDLYKIIHEIKASDHWRDSYKKYVPRFIEEASTKTDWTDWDPDVWNEFFEKSANQCVSSLQQGYFTNNEKIKIKEKWTEVSPLLKRIADNQTNLDLETYAEISKWFRNFTTQNRKASYNRIIASLQPQLLSTIVNEDRIHRLIAEMNNAAGTEVLSNSGTWFEKSNRVLEYFKSQFPDKDVTEIITLPWQLYDYLTNNNTKSNDMSEAEHTTNEIIDLLKYKKQIILQGPPGTGKTREAKEIAKEMLVLNSTDQLKDNEQFRLIQFHPSYTYEDFVRGIVAESNGDRIEYKNVNKTLGEFAEVALRNYVDSQKDTSELSLEKWIDDEFNLFVDTISETLEKEKIQLTENVNLVDLMDDAFLYIGENWKGYEHKMNFKDIKKAYLDKNLTRQDIVKNLNLSGSARQHATYYIVVLNKFSEFLNGKTVTDQAKINEKTYLLIIDEINRANLSSVLGELIYALEYRGEEVESMYEVEGSQKLILPPNLYIIGTMNTADRSVGHIDYAIRRRFAFVDVLPKDLANDGNIKFDSALFKEVKALFTSDDYQTRSKHLSNEFEPKDVALGHSYFIDEEKDGGSMSVRLEYEIKPILLEYVKDGVLIGEDIKQKIENLKSSI